MSVFLRGARLGTGAIALLATVLLSSSCSSWRGVANVPLPGGPGTGTRSYTIYVQVPDTLALNANSRVRVADVYVGSVRAIELRNWVATLTISLAGGVRLPTNATAKIGLTSLLGSQHVELAVPPEPSPQQLGDGDIIPLKNSTAYPTTERTLASMAAVLRGGGIPNLEAITTEVDKALSGNGEHIRNFLNQLATFTAELNRQRDDLTRAIDSAERLTELLAANTVTLDRVLSEFPSLIAYFAEQRKRFTDAVEAVGRFGDVVNETLTAARVSLEADLRLLQRPLIELERSSPYLIGASKLLLTLPFPIDNVPKIVRGDYMNLSGDIDLTLSALDNGLLTGTGFSGALRALEQGWGRDPNTMIPDIHSTPNPNNAPGGPLVERAR
ncbi:virulence factor Mce family protein [Mycolicibacterium septicum DSM 44393]|uniref:Virulence factor Mce family protein n=2 Tax=Mycolicibacterium septicum TaxID=98668 RepID=A0A7X6MMD5_9MYCO|nr:virulence factor Mce family protein [Mycolicibacterium septicum DSM 44393]